MKFFLLRADGSYYLGMGHIMRCVAFAQALEERGVKFVFVIRDYDRKIAELIQGYGYDVETIPPKSSFIEDASLTLNFANQCSANLILTDLSNANSLVNLCAYNRYIKALKEANRFVITIDGYGKECVSARIPILSDITIIPYCGAENEKYKLNSGSNYLLGPSYFIFRREFIKRANINREIKKNVQNILVTMGGSDPFKLTIKITKGLVKLNRTSLNLRVVIGPGFNDSIKQKLGRVLRSFNGNYELVIENFDMAELMFWSDLAITSSGLTKYETAVTGTPSIIISYDNFQEKIMDEFEKYGSALHLGQGKNIHEDDIAKVVNSLLDDSNLRRQMSKKGRDLVDGKGVERVISQIPAKLLP